MLILRHALFEKMSSFAPSREMRRRRFVSSVITPKIARRQYQYGKRHLQLGQQLLCLQVVSGSAVHEDGMEEDETPATKSLEVDWLEAHLGFESHLLTSCSQ